MEGKGKFWISCLHCSNSLLSLEKEVTGEGRAKAAAPPQEPSFSTSFPYLGEFACEFPGLADGEVSGAEPLGP
jgi:hypothetical protein